MIKPRRNSFLLAIFAFAFIILLSSVAIKATTFTVTKIADTNDGICDSDCSLREAISAANTVSSNDFITFDSSVFSTSQTIVLNGTILNIINNRGLIINGPGANLLAISGNNASIVFTVQNNSTVTINAVTIKNGSAVLNSGGAIINFGKTTINNSIIRDNISDSWGGAMYNGGTLTINNSLVTENIAENIGGAIINDENFTLNINNSIISNNSCGVNGGGIYNNNGKVTIIGSTISGNKAMRDHDGVGGGLYTKRWSDDYSMMTILNSTIANNTALFADGEFQNKESAFVS